jgi:sugar lactone lactonase YvrE
MALQVPDTSHRKCPLSERSKVRISVANYLGVFPMCVKKLVQRDSSLFALVAHHLIFRRSRLLLRSLGSALVLLLAMAQMTHAAQNAASVQFQDVVPIVAPGSPGNAIGPFGLAVDKTGDLFVADFNNNRVVKIPAGCMSTACQITLPTTGLSGPTGLTVDQNGNVFVADYNNNRVVEVPWTGSGYGAQITLPSTGQNEPGSVAVNAAGDVFIANWDHTGSTASQVVELPWTGSSYGTPNTVVNWLRGPFGLTFDSSGDLFIADQGSDQVVELSPGCSSSTCQTIVATGLSVNTGPTAVSVDSAGDLFIADGDVVEVPSGCSSSACQINIGSSLNVGLGVLGVAVDSVGNIFAADYGKNELIDIRQNSMDLGSVALGNAESVTAFVNFNSTVTLNSTTPYSLLTEGVSGMDFVDAGGGTCAATTYDNGESCSINIDFKPEFAGSVRGAISVVDAGGNNVAIAYLSGVGTGPQITYLPGTRSSLGVGLTSSPGVAVDREGNIFVADQANRTVEELLAPTYSTARSLGGSFNFTNPVGLALDGAGNIFVADTGSTGIEEILAPAYTAVNLVGSGLSSPSGVAVDGSGNIFVADTGNNSVKEMLAANGYATTKALVSGLSSPAGIAVDNAGNVYIADTGNNSIKEVLAVDGIIPANPVIKPIGAGFSTPAGVTVDNLGNIYVADTGNDAVEELTAVSGFSAMESLGSNFGGPGSVAVDSSGNVYVGSSANSQVVKLDYADAPSLKFAAGAGSTSSPQTVTVINYGNAGLTFASPASGYNPSVSSNFNLQANEGESSPCPILTPSLGAATLAAGASCMDQLTFSSPAGGTVSGSMIITDNDLNVNGSTQTILLSGTAVAITLAPTSLPSAQVGAAYSQTIAASGGTSPYSYQVTSGTLPAGTSIDSSGLFSGTPSAAGSFTFTVSATDANSITGSQAYSLTVSAPAIAVSPASLPAAQVNVAYSQALTASGGSAPYTFKVTAGSLPAGLTLGSAGVLSGTPTANGSFTFTVTATDSSTGTGAPFSGASTYTFTVNAPSITITPASLMPAQVGIAYSSVSLSASGGTGPYSYKISSGSLPAGLALSSVGVLSGTPSAAGTFNFTLTATDANNLAGNQSYSLAVSAATITITPSSLPAAQVNLAYNQILSAAGGTAPYSFKVTAGSLPAGLTLSGAGVLSGTPTVSGSFQFTVAGTDSSTGSGAPFSGTASYTLAVSPPSITIAPASIPFGQVGAAYTLVSLTASGGTAPYSYAVSSGSLPAGLRLSSNGVLSGTPTAGGTVNFTATATDAGKFTGSQAYSITVSAPSISIIPTTLPGAQLNVAYNQTLIASGGTAPYSFQIAGTLPAGLTFSPSTGVISGTPTVGGSFPITVTATDNSTGTGPYTSSINYTLTVNPGTATLTFAPIAPQTYGNPPFTVSASSPSSGTITYSITSGPATINSASGMVTLAGAGEVTIEATQAATSSYNSVVAQMPISVARQNTVSSLTASTSSVALGQSVTLTASVSASVMGTPTGTVTFFDGGTQLGSPVTLTNGTAQIATTNLISGQNTISAVYSGDSNFLPSNSALSAPILVPPADFSFAATGSTSQSVMPGGTATFSFSLAPSSTQYPGPVTFSIQGLPPGASSTISPASVSSGAGPQTITVTIHSPTGISASISPTHSDRHYAPFAFALFLPLLGLRKLRLKNRKAFRALVLIMLLGAGSLSLLPISGCGAVSGILGESYSLSVTASSDTLQHTAFVTVTVK